MASRSGISDRFAEIEKRVDSDEMLTEEQRVEIKERARAHVRKKQIERMTDLLFNEEVRLAETDMAMPDERLEEITIDLPEYAYMIAIDNVGYYHGCTYDVPRRKYLSLIDQMARTWEHDREVHGRRRKGDMVRDPFHRGVNAYSKSDVVTTRDSLRQSLRNQ
jgi:hypothetical protein